jgi:Ser/Thr protein kinase RdoA (MazF antagonist)
MMKWVEGKRYFRKNGPGVRVVRQVGRIMGEMHQHAEDFSPPEEFLCPTWNWERLFNQMPVGSAHAERQLLDTDERKVFRETERRIKAAMEALGTNSDVFGIIHGDLIQANYLIHGGEVRMIDFADFGYGHFLYDLGITLFGLWGLDDENRQRKAFLSGYRDVRPLSLDHESLLDLFIAARAAVQARFVMSSQHSADQQIAARYIQKVVKGLKLWLSTSPQKN